MRERTRELCKDLIIVLLLLSVVFLALSAVYYSGSADAPLLTKLASALDGTQSRPPRKAEEPALTDAAQPLLISVRSGTGRASFWRDDDALDAAYEALGGYLAEALDTAGEAAAISEDEFSSAAAGVGALFRFSGDMPLPVLAAWLDAESGADLAAGVFFLQPQSGGVRLLLRGEDGCWAADTQMDPTALLSSLLAYPADGTLLAAESEDFSRLDPLSLIDPALDGLPAAQSADPCDEAFRTAAAETLGFNPYGDASYRDDAGGTVYTESDCTLRIGADGTLILQNPGLAGRFSASAGSDGARIEYVRALLQALAGDCLGDGRLQFAALYEDGGTTAVEFDYTLSGLSVRQSGGAAVTARFVGPILSELTFRVRTYTLRPSRQLPLLPAAQAAAALPEGAMLAPAYADAGEDELQAGWLR